MGFVEDFSTLFNEPLILPEIFDFKKSVTLSCNVLFIRIYLFKKKKKDDT